jgi:hypothetical protein
MKTPRLPVFFAATCTALALTAFLSTAPAEPPAAASGSASPALPPPALTIYNQNFALVRDTVPLDLQPGVNPVRFTETTAHVETDSVILRDPAGKVPLQILEQNYRNDPVSEGLLLSLNEGKTLDFEIDLGQGQTKVVQGRVIRSSNSIADASNVLQRYGPRDRYGNLIYNGFQNNSGQQPIIEVEGKLRFSLPGRPLFPALADDTVLKPTLEWQIHAPKAVRLNAELAYITGYMSWKADYNVVMPGGSDTADITGWVTMDNQSGKTFANARIKLMAGDVSKLQPANMGFMGGVVVASGMAKSGAALTVTEKAFEDYHLYTLERPATLRDRETKQVEFIRVTGVKTKRVYVYDGLVIDWQRWNGNNISYMRREEDFGAGSGSTKVAIMREIKNSKENGLGMPLPKGRVRFYKTDDDRRPEFTGENEIDHTPKDETVRIYTGNAFDLVGERRRTDFKVDTNKQFVDEGVEIKVRNRKKEPVEIRVVEHLYRWFTWEVREPSQPFVKKDARTIEFTVTLQPDEEKTVTYTAHYTW